MVTNKEIRKEIEKIKVLSDMLIENVQVNTKEGFWAGYNGAKNHNQSNTAIKNQIVTLRNELLVLSNMYSYKE